MECALGRIKSAPGHKDTVGESNRAQTLKTGDASHIVHDLAFVG